MLFSVFLSFTPPFISSSVLIYSILFVHLPHPLLHLFFPLTIQSSFPLSFHLFLCHSFLLHLLLNLLSHPFLFLLLPHTFLQILSFPCIVYFFLLPSSLLLFSNLKSFEQLVVVWWRLMVFFLCRPSASTEVSILKIFPVKKTDQGIRIPRSSQSLRWYMMRKNVDQSKYCEQMSHTLFLSSVILQEFPQEAADVLFCNLPGNWNVTVHLRNNPVICKSRQIKALCRLLFMGPV